MTTCLLQENTEHSDDPWCHHPCPPSILRSLRFASAESVDKIPSVESDMPSLAESSQSAGSCGGELEEELLLFPPQLPNSRAKSVGSSRTITFDPRVWVREFERDPDEREVTWYSSSELEAFKVAAVERIVAFSQTELVATGTGRMVPKRSLRLSKSVFSHTALGTEYEMKLENLFRAVLQNELRRILVVDSHDIFLQLFAKGLQKLVPHAEIVLAGSSQVALAEAAKGRFDVVLVEERLKFLHQKGTSATTSCTDAEARSGTALMKRLQTTLGRAIYIGVSAKYKEDMVLMRSVADLCWSKPPPKMDAVLLREILHKLLSKRERFHAISELYATSC
jgi:CheY-like chemotaxis protein